MKVFVDKHHHDLPPPRYYVRGSIVGCNCGAIFIGGNPGNPAYSSWRRLGWFGVGWRKVMGRI